MRRVWGRGLLVGSLALAVLALAGCGSSDNDGASSANSTTTTSTPKVARMTLTSPQFADGGTIPTEFTCAGGSRIPTLKWSAPPKNTEELAMVVFDPDAPGGGFVHLLTWGIRPSLRGTVPGRLPSGGLPGMNGRGNENWVAPCPPPGGPHHYQFTIFALARAPEIAYTANIRQFLEGIKGTILGEGQLTGLFGR